MLMVLLMFIQADSPKGVTGAARKEEENSPGPQSNQVWQVNKSYNNLFDDMLLLESEIWQRVVAGEPFGAELDFGRSRLYCGKMSYTIKRPPLAVFFVS